ncbi:MAG: outer membrane protein assembly factor BamD, partial [Nitrososphaera sp.]
RYPFGDFSKQAQLDLAYAYYKTEESASAIAACDRFIKLYPTSPHVDYAYYLKGLANFNQGKGLAQRYLPSDLSQRDPGASLQAFRDFTELTKHFPNSRYIRDVRKRMMYLRNILAQHEVNVANFYLWRGAFLAAANRALYVVENYQQAPAMPEALALLVRAYKALQLEELAADTLRVLERNYPNHPRVVDVNGLVVK